MSQLSCELAERRLATLVAPMPSLFSFLSLFPSGIPSVIDGPLFFLYLSLLLFLLEPSRNRNPQQFFSVVGDLKFLVCFFFFSFAYSLSVVYLYHSVPVSLSLRRHRKGIKKERERDAVSGAGLPAAGSLDRRDIGFGTLAGTDESGAGPFAQVRSVKMPKTRTQTDR